MNRLCTALSTPNTLLEWRGRFHHDLRSPCAWVGRNCRSSFGVLARFNTEGDGRFQDLSRPESSRRNTGLGELVVLRGVPIGWRERCVDRDRRLHAADASPNDTRAAPRTAPALMNEPLHG